MGLGWPRQAASAAVERRARGVVWNNQANLAAFTVASDDGITYVQGNTVLLAGQTTATEMGPWVVGAVAAGVAPLTRPSWWAAGATIESGTIIEVGGAGTIFGGTSWKVLAASSIVVGTNDPDMWPRRQKTTVAQDPVTANVRHGAGGDSAPLFWHPTRGHLYADAEPNLGWTAAIVWWYPHTVTRGRAGTAGANIMSANIGAAPQVGDTSTLAVVITNW